MKSYTLFVSILLFVLITAACGSALQDAPEGASAAASVQNGEQAQDLRPENQTASEPGFNRETPLAMTLALGTFKLEGSEMAVDTNQAEEMLVLWKAARSLSGSDNTAVEELEAVVNQIQGVFTSEQLAEIENMELSFQDMRTVAEEMGIELGFGGRFEDLAPEQQATMQAARESGQFPQGGPGGGFPGGGPGGGPGDGPGFSPEMRETAAAERGGFERVNLRLPEPLLDAVIEFLEGKSG